MLKLDTITSSSIASPPVVFQKLQDAINDSDSTFEDFANVISLDPGLSLRVLGFVNSSFYNFPNRVDSILQAVNILGVDQIMNLSTGTLVMNRFKSISKELISLEAFWKHSVACGLATKEIAVLFGETKNLEQYFLLGLLHDIGSLVLLIENPTISQACFNKAEDESRRLYEVEKENIGFSHQDLGGELLRKWGLADCFFESVSFHHNPFKAPRKYRKIACWLHIADTIAYEIGWGNSGEPIVPCFDQKAVEFLLLNEEKITEIRESLKHSFDDIFKLFYS